MEGLKSPTSENTYGYDDQIKSGDKEGIYETENRKGNSRTDTRTMNFLTLAKFTPNLMQQFGYSTLSFIKSRAAKMAATLVPDDIIYNSNSTIPRSYDSCVMLVKLNGLLFTDFSALSRKLDRDREAGASVLGDTLNYFFELVIQECLSHAGDVFNITINTLLLTWKYTLTDSITDVIRLAINCALNIHKATGIRKLNDVQLRVSITIVTGIVVYTTVGTSSLAYYLIVGTPLAEAYKLAKLSKPGETIISESVSVYVSRNEFNAISVEETNIFKITGEGPFWKPVERIGKRILLTYIETRGMNNLYTPLHVKDDDEEEEEFLLRPSLEYAAKNNLKGALCKFIPTQVAEGINNNEPFEYYIEIRHIVIICINVMIPKTNPLSMAKIGDEIYTKVMSIAYNMNGWVDRITFLGQTFQLLLIFGLKGNKYELESRAALRCACECRQSIQSLTNVDCVAIAVTTGICYCGTIGHIMRKSFIPIGSASYRANILVKIAKEGIICDRKTFIQSKMESTNFFLYENYAMKEYTDFGPIYIFSEVSKVENIPYHHHNLYPLLGREKIILLYNALLNNFLDTPNTNSGEKCCLMIIEGEQGQGKTRLLNEIVYITPKQLTVHKIALSLNDVRVPYRAISLILSRVLGITDRTPIKIREDVLLAKFTNTNTSKFVCCLNQVFRTNIPNTDTYISLNENEKQNILQEAVRQICLTSFIIGWVISIDDGEFIDEKSWSLLKVLFDMNLLLIVIAIGNKIKLIKTARDIIDGSNAKSINIENLDKKYIVGLVCQILDVYAIPPELEKIIQLRGEGNPTWVEKYLIGFIHAGTLIVKEINTTAVDEYGLISPPMTMLFRNSQNEAETEGFPPFLEVDDDSNPWSSTDKQKTLAGNLVKKYLLGKLPQDRVVPICFFDKNVDLSKLLTDDFRTDLIIKTMDNLTSYEQLLLKCGSVLGEYFLRSMLIFVLATPKIRTTALAIQKLFEKRILVCAEGDFRNNQCFTTLQRQESGRNYVKIECKCLGIHSNELFKDLPSYALCGYLKFREAIYQQVIYNVLTDNQRKELHERAVQFLCKETHRCSSCGSGVFVRMLGHRHLLEGNVSTKRKVLTKSVTTSLYSHIQEAVKEHDDFSPMYTIPDQAVKDRSSYCSITTFDSQIKIIPAQTVLLSTGTEKIKLKNSFALIRTFSYADFSLCQCPLILDSIYTQMIHHSKLSERYDILITALIEYADISIRIFNNLYAIIILEEAVAVLNHTIEQYQKEKNSNEFLWKIEYTKAKIECLFGQARYNLGQVHEAYSYFQQALHHYGYVFPSSKLRLNLNILSMRCKQTFSLLMCTNYCPINGVDYYKREYYEDVAKCYTCLYYLFKDAYLWNNAELAARKSLDNSLKSHLNFCGVCISYANIIEITHYMKRTRLCIALEGQSLSFCQTKTSYIEIDELYAIGKLYLVIFISRYLRADYEKCIDMGRTLLNICATARATELSIDTLTIHIYALLSRKKVYEACLMLEHLAYYARQDRDNTGKAWYYALSLIVNFQTGFTIETFKSCKKFCETETLSNLRDVESRNRLRVVVWLWYLRTENWELADMWYRCQGRLDIVDECNATINNLYTILYIIEGLLIYTSYIANDKNKSGMLYNDIHPKVKNLMRIMERHAKTSKAILPRLYHYKAYFYIIQDQAIKAFQYLNKATKFAKKHNDLLEQQWIRHSSKAWKGLLPPSIKDFWTEHSRDIGITYHQANNENAKMVFFTLPLNDQFSTSSI